MHGAFEMPKKPPLRSPSDTHRRQAIAERRIGARQCGCGEARPQALIAGSRPLVCAACQRANNGQSTEDDHHIAGAANDETTISVPVNDHRADLTIAQSDWPKATLQNSEGSPLLAGAACIREPKLLDPTPSERIERDLHNISRNQIEWWLQLTLDMSLEPTSTNHTNDLELDLTTLPGWKEADTGTRERILNAARDYVNDADPHNENWFSSPSTPYSAIGGARALALLQTAAPEILDAISSQTWQKWVPSLVRYPVTRSEERRVG